MRYVVIIEKGEKSYGAYAPDVLGCVAVGETIDETIQLFQEALVLHFEAMREQGEKIPEPSSFEEAIAMHQSTVTELGQETSVRDDLFALVEAA